MKLKPEHLQTMRAVVDGNIDKIDRQIAENLVGARFMRRLPDSSYEILPKGRKALLAGTALEGASP